MSGDYCVKRVTYAVGQWAALYLVSLEGNFSRWASDQASAKVFKSYNEAAKTSHEANRLTGWTTRVDFLYGPCMTAEAVADLARRQADAEEHKRAVDRAAADLAAGKKRPDSLDVDGMSDKDFAGLRTAEEKFRFRREWLPQQSVDTSAPIDGKENAES